MNTTLPRISVIVAVRNMQQYIGHALQSVIAQNYPNCELMVMDGGSTDGTLDIIKKYEKHISYLQSKPDKGPANAANIAIDIATGDLIGFLNADDILEPGLFHKMAAIYQQKPHLSMISCGINVVKITKTGQTRIQKVLTKACKLQLTLPNMLHELTAFNGRYYHKDIFTRYGKFKPFDADGKWNLSNDREFLIRLTLNQVQSEIIEEPLYTYLSHEGSFSFNSTNLPRIYREHLILGRQLLKQNLSSSDQLLVHRWIATEAINLFLISLFLGHIKSAITSAFFGITNYPLLWFKQLTVRICEIGSKRLKNALSLQGTSDEK